MRIRTVDDAEKCKELSAGEWADTPDIGSLTVRVAGAGYISFGQYDSWTGSAHGINVDCSWSRHGYSGGVMDRKEIAELRDYLTAFLDGTLEKIELPE